MTNLRRRWFTNSLVNILGGGASAVASLFLPSLMVHYLDAESFSIWNLALQVVVYVSLLSLGLQSAIARTVAHVVDSSNTNNSSLPEIVYAARNISCWASVAALMLVLVLVFVYPWLFPDVKHSLLSDFRMTLGFFGIAAVSQILSQADMGIFQGLHRNSVFVVIQTISRFLTLILVWIGICMQQSMMVLSGLVMVGMSVQWPIMRWAVLRFIPWSKQISKVALNKRYRRELLGYCGTLSVWSISMLLVNSIGILIVGHQDFLMAGSYGVAMTAASVLVGLLGAFLSPLMTTTAGMYANEYSRKQLPRLLTLTTLIFAVFLNSIVMIMIACYHSIIEFWLGESLINTVGPLMVILTSGYCLRNIAAPYSLMLVGTGLNNRALISAVLEGLANVVASVILGVEWGAVGVAAGTLVGSVVGVAGTLLLNTFNTPELTPRPIRFSVTAIILPISIFIPIDIYLATLNGLLKY